MASSSHTVKNDSLLCEYISKTHPIHMAVCQNLVPLVNIKIAGKWMFIPLKMVLIGIDSYPYLINFLLNHRFVSGIIPGNRTWISHANIPLIFHCIPMISLLSGNNIPPFCLTSGNIRNIWRENCLVYHINWFDKRNY